MYEREVVVVREEAPVVRHIVRERPVYQRVYYVEEPGFTGAIANSNVIIATIATMMTIDSLHSRKR